jgi:hypothetical protein
VVTAQLTLVQLTQVAAVVGLRIQVQHQVALAVAVLVGQTLLVRLAQLTQEVAVVDQVQTQPATHKQ